jgi:hypothetical protein
MIQAPGGQSYNLYLNVVHFFNIVLIRHLWQLKTVVFLHRCLICAVPLIGLMPEFCHPCPAAASKLQSFSNKLASVS